jgi:hypothetical protein
VRLLPAHDTRNAKDQQAIGAVGLVWAIAATASVATGSIAGSSGTGLATARGSTAATFPTATATLNCAHVPGLGKKKINRCAAEVYLFFYENSKDNP